MDRWFAADDANQAGWRRILTAQRLLRLGHVTAAITTIEALDADFADLEKEERLDLTLRASTMLTYENQPVRARDLVVTALEHTIGYSEDNVNTLLDRLEEAAPPR